MDKKDETAERLFWEAVGLPRDRRTAFLVTPVRANLLCVGS